MDRNSPAYAAAGQSYDTKFDLKQALDLSYATERLSVLPVALCGQTSKQGGLHPSLVYAVQAAYKAVSS